MKFFKKFLGTDCLDVGCLREVDGFFVVENIICSLGRGLFLGAGILRFVWEEEKDGGCIYSVVLILNFFEVG